MTIISYQHDFIFVKTRKVAGTSVEAFLRTLTGPDDVVTRLTPRDEYFCASQGHRSRNYARKPSDEAEYTDLVLANRFDEALGFGRSMKKRFDSHMRIGDIRRKVGRRRFSSFFSFCIERDPYSWLVSVTAYDKSLYHAGEDGRVGLDELRQRIRDRLNRRKFLEGTNYHYYTIGEKLGVDRVIRFERLEEELAETLTELGIETTVDMPRLKENPQEWGIEEIFTPELDALARERMAPVFKLLGYPYLER